MESFTTTPAESYIELRDRIETFILSLDSRVKANHGLADWHEERGNEEGASRFRLRASLLKGVIGDARGFLLGDNDWTPAPAPSSTTVTPVQSTKRSDNESW
jgi:hypothetical protein